MSAHMTFHDIASIDVKKKYRDGISWLEIDFNDNDGERHQITVFAKRGSDGFDIDDQVIKVQGGRVPA